MSTHDQNQDEREVFDPQSAPSRAGKEPGKFTQIFSPYNAGSPEPAPGSGPIDTKNGVSGHQLVDSQSNPPSAKSKPGDFTRVFGKDQVQPASDEFAFKRQEEPSKSPSFPQTPPEALRQSGTFTRIFGKSDNQPQGQSIASPSSGFAKPETSGPEAARSSMDPVLFKEKNVPQSSPPLRGSFEERAVPPASEGFSDIFRNTRQTPPDPFARFRGLSASAIPINPQPSAATPGKRQTDIFADDNPNLNAAKMPGGPSDYTRVVNSSALRSSQENSGAAPPASPAPQANLPRAPQVAQAYQMMQMPQPQMMQTPQIQVPQMIPGQPMVQMPSMAPLPQPSLPVPPQAQPLPQDSGNSRWASYMPLIIALNVFLLLAMLLILIVFLASKK